MFGINEKNQRAFVLASALAILVAVSFITRWANRPSGVLEVNAMVQRTLGDLAAGEISNLISNRGKIAVIVVDATEEQVPPAARMQAEFAAALAKNKNIQIVATQKVSPSDVMDNDAFAIPAAMFTSLVNEYPDLDGIVSFAGVPKLTPAQMQRVANKLPAFVAVCALGYQSPWEKGLLQAGLVQAIVVPNSKPVAVMPGSSRATKEWLDVYYVVARPETADLVSGSQAP